MEESVGAEFGRREEDDETSCGEADHPVVDLPPLQTESEAVLGLDPDTNVLEWTDLATESYNVSMQFRMVRTYFELLVPPSQATVEPLGDLSEADH